MQRSSREDMLKVLTATNRKISVSKYWFTISPKFFELEVKHASPVKYGYVATVDVRTNEKN